MKFFTTSASLFLTLLFISSNAYGDNSIQHCNNLSNQIGQYGDAESAYLDMVLDTRRKAVEQLFGSELEKHQPDYFTKGEMIDSILSLVKFDEDIEKRTQSDDNAFDICITLDNVQTSSPDDLKRFEEKRVAEICHDNPAFVDEKIAEYNDRFIENLKTGNLSNPIRSMLNEPDNIKLQNYDQINRFTKIREFKTDTSFLSGLHCKELYVRPIDLYIASSPREISSTISLLPPVDASDKEGKKAEFQVVVIHRDYSWKKSSVDTIEKEGKEIKGFSQRFKNPRFIELSTKHLRDIVSLGMSSCEGDVKRETERAKKRTESVLKWLSDAFGQKGEVDIYGINLGKHKYKNTACKKVTEETRSSQRALILIGVVKGSDPDIDLQQAINNALEKIAKEQPEKLPINPKDYLEFDILDVNGSFKGETTTDTPTTDAG